MANEGAQPLDEGLHGRAKSACWRTQARLSLGDGRRALEQRVQSPAGRPPVGRIRPLSPSRTSSRLAGRSDSSGSMPWAMASSTDTATESLLGRLRYHWPGRTRRPAWRRPAGRRTAPWRQAQPTRPGTAAPRAATRRWPPPGATRAAAATMAAKTSSTRSGVDRLQATVGEARSGSLACGAGGIASSPKGNTITSAAPSRACARPSPASRWW
jgi:hypothetical protein